MHEIVIVIADLYLPRDGDEARTAAGALAAPPALAQLLRFGTRAPGAPGGWREWLARWLGRADLAAVPVANVAAAGSGVREDAVLWLATPMHWVAGMRGVQLDGRAILRLTDAELGSLAADFNAAFRHSAVALQPLGAGELLAHGPDAAGIRTVEPARAWLAGLAESLPAGTGATAAALRRLGSELEMWLRDQAVNRARAARGERTVSALWFWGGPSAPAGVLPPRLHESPAQVPTLALGSDAYLTGLARLAGARAGPLPEVLDAGAAAQRTVLVIELAGLGTGEDWSLAGALAEADRRYIAPALAALQRGAAGALTVLANDRVLVMRPAHRLRLWRRPRAGLAVLA
ncbi:MAG TPA: hypothetical protein VFO23_11705 [Steroidobacteraceae bacterium]|nr:hypothetical protein [Steroidobacteraceae bacterium]